MYKRFTNTEKRKLEKLYLAHHDRLVQLIKDKTKSPKGEIFLSDAYHARQQRINEELDKHIAAMQLAGHLYMRHFGYVLEYEARRDEWDYQKIKQMIAEGTISPHKGEAHGSIQI